MSFVIESASRVMALSFRSESDGVGSPIILEAIRVILKSLFLLGIGSISVKACRTITAGQVE